MNISNNQSRLETLYRTVTELAENQTALIKKVDDLNSALVGTTEKKGWLGRVGTLEDSMAVVMRVVWGFVAVFFIGAGTYIWQLITHVPK